MVTFHLFFLLKLDFNRVLRYKVLLSRANEKEKSTNFKVTFKNEQIKFHQIICCSSVCSIQSGTY